MEKDMQSSHIADRPLEEVLTGMMGVGRAYYPRKMKHIIRVSFSGLSDVHTFIVRGIKNIQN